MVFEGQAHQLFFFYNEKCSPADRGILRYLSRPSIKTVRTPTVQHCSGKNTKGSIPSGRFVNNKKNSLSD